MKKARMIAECDSCTRKYAREDALPCIWPNIPGINERLEPGGIVPLGECLCGALVYPIKEQNEEV